MPRPIRNVTPGEPSRPRFPRWLGVAAVVLFVVVLCVLFPRMLAFVELAARELRYFWWLILLALVGGYFFFFFGRKK
jgi:hypothetical protein